MKCRTMSCYQNLKRVLGRANYTNGLLSSSVVVVDVRAKTSASKAASRVETYLKAYGVDVHTNKSDRSYGDCYTSRDSDASERNDTRRLQYQT